MNSHLTMYITTISLTGIFNLFLCLYVFPRRTRVPTSRLLILYSALLAVYSFGYAFELSSQTIDEIKRWNLLEYIGMPFSVPVGLLIVLRYLGTPLARPLQTAVFAMPVVTWIILATNDSHRYFYQQFRLSDDPVSPHLVIEVAEWYIVFNSFVFCCWLICFFLLLARWRQSRRPYRPQLLALIGGQAAPMIAGLAYLFELLPPGFDPVPIGLTVSSGLYVWALLANRQLTVVPIAKETIFDTTEIGFIVLDSTERLVDYNRTTARIFPGLQASMIGRDFDPLWSELTGMPASIRLLPNGSLDKVIWTVSGGSPVCYQIRTSVLKHPNGEEAGHLLSLANVTALKRLQSELEHQAYYDGLTQIYNRTHFVRLARELLEQCASGGRPFTVVLFDIDFFKRVNDTYGHDMGDKVIRHVVSVCRGRMEEEMLFARYGGEEFVIALPGYDLAGGQRFAESLRIAIETAPLEVPQAPQGAIALTSSFGAAEARAGGGAPGKLDKFDKSDKLDKFDKLDKLEKLDSLLGRADEALYASKRNGRNCVSAAEALPCLAE
ncbi:histidine kinase N-terminal 7TM domain-containing protein [Cohnella fermenti]|uniref:Diguanylate cyclase n=1 Tax=Cohnella fermenti TaxID=2565925 RepID=A0A4S4C1V5_9BACL|nr:histidine kinase N-terminal 7TM domain-containing protein [Cohnella fermenti]THF81644.1 diguanylate cyclase [Cohnella fermenti]